MNNLVKLDNYESAKRKKNQQVSRLKHSIRYGERG